MFDSSALTKVQSIVLVAIIVVAAVGGGVAYFLLGGQDLFSESIKIGVLADLDATNGKQIWQGALLAAEQINAEGGILGRQVEVIGEDHDGETVIDINIASSALTRLLTYHNVDYVTGSAGVEIGFMIQDVIAEHKKIYISCLGATTDAFTERVADDYDTYKYFFKYMAPNSSQVFKFMVDQFLYAREITGFNKVGYLADDHGWTEPIIEGLEQVLNEVYGFDLVYGDTFPFSGTFDFSSYLAVAEAAGVEILMPMIYFDSGVAFVKEYYEQQSPMIVYGGLLTAASAEESWEWTDGKCEYITTQVQPITVGYPLTSKSMPFRDAYVDRWGESPLMVAASSYDVIRFVLFDALERAGTTETEAVIEALEDTRVETALARNFVFTSNHDIMYGEGWLSNPDGYGHTFTLFQWLENGVLVPIYPNWLMEEAGATYTFPDWAGPWDE